MPIYWSAVSGYLVTQNIRFEVGILDGYAFWTRNYWRSGLVVLLPAKARREELNCNERANDIYSF